MSSGLTWNSDCVYLYLHVWSNIFMFDQIFLCCYDWNACAELLLQCCMRWIQTRSVICVSNPSPTTADSRAVCLYPCKNYRLWTILNLTTTNLIVTTSLVQSCSCCHKITKITKVVKIRVCLLCLCAIAAVWPHMVTCHHGHIDQNLIHCIVETKSQYCKLQQNVNSCFQQWEFKKSKHDENVVRNEDNWCSVDMLHVPSSSDHVYCSGGSAVLQSWECSNLVQNLQNISPQWSRGHCAS